MVFGKAFDTANVASTYAAAVGKGGAGDGVRAVGGGKGEDLADSLRAAKREMSDRAKAAAEKSDGGDVERTDSLRAAKVDGRRSEGALNGPNPRMSAARMELMGFNTPGEAIRNFSGVTLLDYGGAGGLQTVSVRGFGSQHTALFIDGLNCSDLQTGTADLSIGNIAGAYSVSLTIGDNEDIFKSAAQMVAASSVVINSERPDFGSKGYMLEGRLSYGSFRTVEPSFVYRQRLGKRSHLSASVNYLHSRGDFPYRLPNDTDTLRRREGGGIDRLRPALDLTVGLRDAELKAKVLSDFAFSSLPGPAVLHASNASESLNDKHIAALVSYNKMNFGSKHRDGTKQDRQGKAATGRWSVRTQLSFDWRHCHWTDTSGIYTVPAQEDYKQFQTGLSATALCHIISGLDISIAEDFSVGHLNTTLPDCPFPTRISSLSALSAAYRKGILSSSATLAFSCLHDFVRSGEESGTRYHFCPSLNCSLGLPYGLRLRVSVRDSYRAPSFNDLYWTRIGTRSLRSEKAFQSNFGLLWKGDWQQISAEASADAYCNLVRDKIVASPSLFIWSMHNIGKALMGGCDLNASAHIQPFANQKNISIDLNGSYSFLQAMDISDPEAANYRHQIRYIPRNSGNAGIALSTPWFRLSYSVVAVGQRWFHDENTIRSRMAPYSDHRLSLGHDFRISRHGIVLSLRAEAMNLGGENYEIIRSYPMPGRHYRISLTIKHNP